MLYTPKKNIISALLIFIIFTLSLISLFIYLVVAKNLDNNDRQYVSIELDLTNKLNICKDNYIYDNKTIYSKNSR